jgi:two-component system sensor histidine kinase HydH
MTWQPEIESDKVASKVRRIADGTTILDLAKRFMPLAPLYPYFSPEEVGDESYLQPHTHAGSIIVLGMRMDHLEVSRQSDIRHAIVMGVFVFALGSGALFFIFVIQNYYLIEKTLHSTEDYARKIVASMASGLISTDATGHIVTSNQNARELLGISSEEITGMHMGHLMDLDRTGITQTLQNSIPVINHEIQYQTPSGKSNPLAISATPINDNGGNCNGVVILINDLRQIRQLEEKIRRSEKLAAIGQLSAGVAHEIRNPLSSIRGFAGFLARALTDRPREQGYAEVMVREVDRINQVVTDLLTLANPHEISVTAISVPELIGHVTTLVAADAEDRKIQITTDLPSTMPNVQLDENQITQALLNLLLNAIQFSPEDSGQITIGSDWNEPLGRLRFWVQDNGPGLSTEQRRNMFDPFFTTREQGTGLGLAIVHNITENHGGQIQVDSPPRDNASGTRITLVFPAQKSEESHATENPDR